MARRLHLQQLLAWMLTRNAGSRDHYVEVPKELFRDLIDVVTAASNAKLKVERED
jgi:hypothetical protein